MIEWLKSHPKLVIGGAIGFIILVYLLNHSSSSSTTSSDGSTTDVQAATALQTAQLQANQAANQTAAAVQANSDTLAAQQNIASLQYQYQTTHDQLAAGVATSQINADQQVQSLLGQLSADVQINGQNQQTAQTTVIATNQTQQQQILANALVTQSANQANVSIAALNAQTQIATQSWFDKIF